MDCLTLATRIFCLVDFFRARSLIIVQHQHLYLLYLPFLFYSLVGGHLHVLFFTFRKVDIIISKHLSCNSTSGESIDC